MEIEKQNTFLLAIAPPHGKGKYHNYSTRILNRNDDFPEGCPCGLKEEFVTKNLIIKELGSRV